VKKMGKKYIPIELNSLPYRVYLSNLHKIYKVAQKILPPIPTFCRRNNSRKESLETVPDVLAYFEAKDLEL
jgi:hypothetical protein